jgi:hypothetical protein
MKIEKALELWMDLFVLVRNVEFLPNLFLVWK